MPPSTVPSRLSWARYPQHVAVLAPEIAGTYWLRWDGPRETGVVVPTGLTTNDRSALARLQAICAGLPRADEGDLQGRPLFRVGRRRFALFNGEGSPPRPRWDRSGLSLHFLADPAEIDALRNDSRFAPSPHHGHRGWLALRLDTPDLDWTEVAELVESAYRQVAGRDGVDEPTSGA